MGLLQCEEDCIGFGTFGNILYIATYELMYSATACSKHKQCTYITHYAIFLFGFMVRKIYSGNTQMVISGLVKLMTKLMCFAISKDEMNSKEDSGKSIRNALYVLRYAKRHLSG